MFPPFRKHHVEATTTVTHCGRVAFYIATYRLSSTHVMITRYEYQAITSAMFILLSLGPPEKISVKMLTITATIINKFAFPESNGVHNFQWVKHSVCAHTRQSIGACVDILSAQRLVLPGDLDPFVRRIVGTWPYVLDDMLKFYIKKSHDSVIKMETSALVAFCVGNSPVTGELPWQKPVTRSFDVFFDLCLNKRLSKQSWCWWFQTPSHSLWRHCNEHWFR